MKPVTTIILAFLLIMTSFECSAKAFPWYEIYGARIECLVGSSEPQIETEKDHPIIGLKLSCIKGVTEDMEIDQQDGKDVCLVTKMSNPIQLKVINSSINCNKKYLLIESATQ